VQPAWSIHWCVCLHVRLHVSSRCMHDMHAAVRAVQEENTPCTVLPCQQNTLKMVYRKQGQLAYTTHKAPLATQALHMASHACTHSQCTAAAKIATHAMLHGARHTQVSQSLSAASWNWWLRARSTLHSHGHTHSSVAVVQAVPKAGCTFIAATQCIVRTRSLACTIRKRAHMMIERDEVEQMPRSVAVRGSPRAMRAGAQSAVIGQVWRTLWACGCLCSITCPAKGCALRACAVDEVLEHVC